MKPRLYFALLLIQIFFIVVNADGQDPAWAWVKTLHATNGIYGHAIAIDPNGSGDIYLAGGFEGYTDFDPGPNTFTLYSGNVGDVASFVSKYDMHGNFIWAKAMSKVGVGSGSMYAIVIDPNGSGAVYTAGRFDGTIDFDPGANSYNLTADGANDIVISKLDIDGNFVWAKKIGGLGQDYAKSIAFDPAGDGSIYTTGQFTGSVDFDPGDSTYTLMSKGGFDLFISKLNSSGEFQWTKTIGKTGNDSGRAIAFDPAGIGKVYTTGEFSGMVDFDPGDSTFILTAAPQTQENFLVTLDGLGNFVRAQQMGIIKDLSSSDRFGSIALDPDGSGSLYITGPFSEPCDFDPGPDSVEMNSEGNVDVFISKFSRNGEFIWTSAIGGSKEDDVLDIAIQPGGINNVFTFGIFKGTADFDPDPVNTFSLSPEGLQDLFITKFDSSGHFLWVKSIKGTANPYPQCIVADNRFLYVSGAIFGASSGSTIKFDSLTLNGVGDSGADLFMAKLDFLVATSELNSEEQKIKYYPNPATNELNIESNGDELFDVDVTLFNILGEVVYYSPGENIGQKNTIDISALSPGMYVVELNIGGHRFVEKVVKE